MKNTARLLTVMSLVVSAAAASSWLGKPSAARENPSATGAPAATSGYVCPMHPDYTSDHAGFCPRCGMRLVTRSDERRPLDDLAGALPGTVRVSDERRQLAGVRVMEAAVTPARQTLRFLGRVAADEARTASVTAGIDGFVREVSSVTAGSVVRRGQHLGTFSAPDAIPAMQNYVVALHAMDRLKKDGAEGAAQAEITSTSANFQQRLEKLQDLGMSDAQIAEVRRTRLVPDGIEIRSPLDGVVLARNISTGQRFSRGADWFRIADLRRVWIFIEAVGTDADHVHPGMRATVSVPRASTTVEAAVSAVLPRFDGETRAFEVRLEAANPASLMVPGMLVDVELSIALPPSIVLPIDAVLDSGRDQTVFVDRGEGILEPRAVRTGWRDGGRVQIVNGLAPGERVVTSGTFLIDSESRITSALGRFSQQQGVNR